MAKKILFIGDWSNIRRGQGDIGYMPEVYNKEASFEKLKQWLSKIGNVVWAIMYTPLHDVYGHFEFLRDQGFHIGLCPIQSATHADTTDTKLIEDAKVLIENFTMDVLCLASGDKGFQEILRLAKSKGIQIAIVYGSELSLSGDIRCMADIDPLTCEPMLYHFDPTNV